jgi:DNA-binding NtrC family response regulator
MIPGKSSTMVSLYQQMHSLAESDVSVLLIGETGTGKEMFARMLHASGKRASGPFIAVNSAAIPAELFESELFGIGEKVATDVSKRKGKFELAHEGTFFLTNWAHFRSRIRRNFCAPLRRRPLRGLVSITRSKLISG